jgi:hypothetical protein
MNINKLIAAVVLLLAPLTLAQARNIDLSTIPSRDTVQLTIYNSEDLTLVRETRRLTFKKGLNPLQFSWANTLIDPTSVDLRFRSHAGELNLLDTAFPHDKPQMLYWNVDSLLDGDAVVEISYFTSGITWSADYRCVSNAAETQMGFDGFVRISNNSGEDYDDAEIRLVVGKINLVQRVAELAQRGMISEEDADGFRSGKKRLKEMAPAARRQVLDAAAKSMAVAEQMSSKDIVREGLSEYFIFSIPGTESVSHGWSKRMRLFAGQATPFTVEYRYRPQEYGDRLVRLFLLRNDEASDLGQSPLPDGIVRLYRENGPGDRTESRCGPGGGPRTHSPAQLPRQLLVSPPRDQRLLQPERGAPDPDQRHRRRLGRPPAVGRSHPQLPRRLDQGPDSSQLRRPRPVRQRPRAETARLSNAPVLGDGAGRRTAGPGLRAGAQAGAQPEAEQRDPQVVGTARPASAGR